MLCAVSGDTKTPLYVLKSKVKSKRDGEVLVILAAAWIVLKLSLIAGLILQFLTPYVHLKDVALQIYTETGMITAITVAFYAKIRKEM